MASQSDRNRGDSAAVSKALTIDDLRNFFHLPIVEVAKQLGTCTTALKKICRKNKIMKWPYRQIRSITKSIQSLEMASLNDTLPDDLKFQYREQVFELQKAIDEIVHDPNTDVSMHLKENFELEGDDFDEENEGSGGGNGTCNETNLNSRRYSGPSNSVMQIMQAAAATAGFESSSGKSSSNSASKRKREEDNLKFLKESNPAPEVPPPSIGLTRVGLVSTADAYRNIFFVGPVQLAPLQRKKVKSTKKLVPLIEPDICNHYKMEFLPNSILHHSDKYANKDLESSITVGYPPTSVAAVAPGSVPPSGASLTSPPGPPPAGTEYSAAEGGHVHGAVEGSAAAASASSASVLPAVGTSASSALQTQGQQQPPQQMSPHSQALRPQDHPVAAQSYVDYNAYNSAASTPAGGSSFNNYHGGSSSYGGVKNT